MSRREASNDPPGAAATKASADPAPHTPNDATAALHAAVQHHHAGQLDKAQTLYRRILRSHPEHPDAVHLLGVIAHQRGQNAAAEDLIRKAIRFSPRVADYHNNLGNALQAQGKRDEAEASFRRALSLEPRLAPAHDNLGNVLRERGELTQAEESYRQALEIEPRYFAALNHLGNVLRSQGKFAQAEESNRRALALDPESAEALSNLGNALQDQGKMEQAVACYRKALRIRPDLLVALNNLGNALKGTDRLDEAMECYERVLAVEPDYENARVNQSLLLLLRGEFEQGWANYLCRSPYRCVGRDLFRERLPKDLGGQTILLLRDQGLGDEIFFLRFAPELKARGASMTYLAGAKIGSIVARLPFIDRVVREAEESEEVDFTLSVGDLPFILGMKSAADIPPPYPLPVQPERAARMEARLQRLGPPPHVGLTWRAGTPNKPGAVFKVAPLDEIAKALCPAKATFLALQRKPEAGEIDQLSGGLGRPVHDFTAANEDLEEMLALLSLMDEYVTVSNTNVHLRAATGRTSRVLVPNPPEYRWMAEGEESPWFPGCKVYRQKVDGAWEEAFKALARDLKEAFRDRAA